MIIVIKEVTIVMVEDDLGHARLIEKNIRRANIAVDRPGASCAHLITWLDLRTWQPFHHPVRWRTVR